MNVKKHEVTVDGEPVTLTLKEFELLERLMRNQHIVADQRSASDGYMGIRF